MPDLGYALRLLASPYALLMTAVTAVALAAGAEPLARRYGASKAVAAGAIVSAGVVLAITAPVTYVQAIPQIGQVWSWARFFGWVGERWTDVLLLPTGLEGWANLVLFVPAGVAWTLLTRRAALVAIALTMVSALAESLQAGVGMRVAEPRDLVANVVGALVGVLAGALVVRVRRDGGAATARSLVAPRPLAAAAAVVAVVVIGVSAAASTIRDTAADEQADLLMRVEEAYRGTTAADLTTIDDGAAYSAFASRPGLAADYLGRAGDDIYEARFSLAGHARPRCVVVRWTQDGVRAAPATGSPCTVFKDLGL